VRRALNGRALQTASANGHAAHGVVGNVPLVIAVDHILCGPVPLGSAAENSVQLEAVFISKSGSE